MNIFKRIKIIFSNVWFRRNSKAYIAYLRKKGMLIGEGCHIDPKTVLIDETRPSLVSIGANCYFNRNFSLLTHDWVTKVFIESGRDFLPSSGEVIIGNNVSFGQNVMVLKGVSIGDNCFIGAGSIVTKSIPANSIAVGSPCRVIMSLEEYYQRRLIEHEEESIKYALSIKRRYNRDPSPSDFWEEFPLFVSGDQIDAYPNIPIRRQLGKTYDRYKETHRAKYDGFDDFLRAVREFETKEKSKKIENE